MKIIESLDDIVGNINDKFKTTSLNQQHKALTVDKKKLVAQRDQITAAVEKQTAKMETEVQRYFNPDRQTINEAQPYIKGEDFPPKQYDLKAAVDGLLRLHYGDQRRAYLRLKLTELSATRDPIDKRLVEIDDELKAIKVQLLEG